MKIAFFDTHTYDRRSFEKAAFKYSHEFMFISARLSEETVALAKGADCVCAFVNDKLSAEVISKLSEYNIKIIALRSAGFNHVNLEAAKSHNIKVIRVPEYSPYAVAEHAVALILTLNRKIHKSYNRVREGNFSLEGLEGFDLHGKTIGVIGTGRIGKKFINIMNGFGCNILAFDKLPEPDLKCEYESFEEVLGQSDILSLHLPLSKETFHLLDEKAFALMKKGAMFINTSRGGLVDTRALIKSLKSCHLGSAGLDVYEEEEKFFFQDHSFEVLTDDILARLMTFPNVILTSHQAFLTQEALQNIAETTLENLTMFEKKNALKYEIIL